MAPGSPTRQRLLPRQRPTRFAGCAPRQTSRILRIRQQTEPLHGRAPERTAIIHVSPAITLGDGLQRGMPWSENNDKRQPGIRRESPPLRQRAHALTPRLGLPISWPRRWFIIKLADLPRQRANTEKFSRSIKITSTASIFLAFSPTRRAATISLWT